MSNYFDFSSNEFFIGTTYKNNSISDKENLLLVLNKKKLDIKYISDADQVHSNKVLYIMNPGTYHNLDGFITNKDSKLILIIKTADCIPMFVFDKVNKNYGIVHAGWKGIYSKIHLHIINKLLNAGSKVNHLNVILGPSIKSCCYEVGIEMTKFFESKHIINNNGKHYLDLNQCIIKDLKDNGIGNIQIDQTCTYEEKKCYSYRKKNNGRMYSFITLM